MATFSKTGFKTLNYNSFRPRYPPSFYKVLADYVKESGERHIKTLDIGCGTGIATYDLLNISDEVEGIDHSSPMVDTCNQVKSSKCEELGVTDSSRISFSVGDLDNLPITKSYDLITAAQCLHWCKDFPSFFNRAHSILKPGGVLAYWFYVDPVIIDFSNGGSDTKYTKSEALQKAKDIYFKYAYDDPKLLGPHWEQPGRTIIKDFYRDINNQVPQGLFADSKTNFYNPELAEFAEPDENTNLTLVKKDCSIRDMQKYLSTYSAYHNYISANEGSSLLEDYVNEVYDTLGWSDNTKITMVWNTGYTFLRKAN